jgi:glucose-6-phosphate 1-dehydrogenase
LIYESIRGENSSYVEAEEQLAAWRILTPVLNTWKQASQQNMQSYEAGTWGPASADFMLKENGHHWLLLEN